VQISARFKIQISPIYPRLQVDPWVADTGGAFQAAIEKLDQL
jgi:hypothetical protein